MPTLNANEIFLLPLFDSVVIDPAHERIDETNCIIRGVKVCGTVVYARIPDSQGVYHKKPVRRYTDDFLTEVTKLYDGIDVYLNHDAENASSRAFQDRIGWLENVRFEKGRGVFADFHYVPVHKDMPLILDMVKRRPQKLGFSQSARGEGQEGQDGVITYYRPLLVNSVDLVTSPGHAGTIFDSMEIFMKTRTITAASVANVPTEWGRCVKQILDEAEMGMAPEMAVDVPAAQPPAADAKSMLRQMLLAEIGKAFDDESLDLKATKKAIANVTKRILGVTEKLTGESVGGEGDGGGGEDEPPALSEDGLRTMISKIMKTEVTKAVAPILDKVATMESGQREYEIRDLLAAYGRSVQATSAERMGELRSCKSRQEIEDTIRSWGPSRMTTDGRSLPRTSATPAPQTQGSSTTGSYAAELYARNGLKAPQ